jgi:hypothetical protein
MNENKDRIIKSLEWMLESLKLNFKLTMDAIDLPDEYINWSPEMREAMEVLEELKRE